MKSIAYCAVVLVIATVLGTVVGVCVGSCVESAHVEAQGDPDEEICEGVARRITTNSSSLDYAKLRADIYQNCVTQRDERRRYERDALDAEYLERLQACEQRYEEIYGAWMACADPDEVEEEDDAGCPAAAR